MIHRFTFLVAEKSPHAAGDELYGLCNDVTYSTCDDCATIHFDREADTLDEAIKSAAKQVRQVGLTITHIQFEAQDVESLQCHAPT